MDVEPVGSHGVSRLRLAIYLAILLAACGAFGAYWVARARPMLDEATVVRRAYLGPWRNATYEERFYSIDWPAFARWVWRGVFTVTGWRWPEFDDAHYEFDPAVPLYPKNLFPNGATPADAAACPRGPVFVLRAVSAAFLASACVVLFFLARWLFKSAGAGLAAALPVLAHPAMGQWAVGYPGTDAMLIFWMVAFLAVWTAWHASGAAWTARRVLVVALVAGLAAATKINGGLLTVAFAMYMLAFGPPRRKWWLAALFAAGAFAVFVAVNPVLWQPGAGGLVRGIRDIFARRRAVMEEQERFLAVAAPWVYFKARIAFAALVPLAAYALYRARNERWMTPVAVWSAVLAAGSYVMLNRYDARLALPIDLALAVPAVFALISLTLSQARRLRQATLAPLPCDRAGRESESEGGGR